MPQTTFIPPEPGHFEKGYPPPPIIDDDPARAIATGGSGLSTQLHAPFAAEADEGPAAAARAAEVSAAYATPAPMWKDIPLAPLAISREGDWLLHRTALGAPPLEQIISQPQAMIGDALRVLWFLAHDPAEWLSLPSMQQIGDRWVQRTAQERALDLETRIRKWGDQHVANEEHGLLVTLFYQLYNGTRETRTAVKQSPHHDPVKAGN